jgi:hypothetical protein
LKVDPLVFRFLGGRPGTLGRGRGLEPVGVAFEGDDPGVVEELVGHGGGHVVAAGAFPAREEELEKQVGATDAICRCPQRYI